MKVSWLPTLVLVVACGSPPATSSASPPPSAHAAEVPDASTPVTRPKGEGPFQVGPNDDGKVLEVEAGRARVMFSHPGMLDKTVTCAVVKTDDQIRPAQPGEMGDLVFDIPRRPGIAGRHDVTVECTDSAKKTKKQTTFAIVVMWH